MAQPAGPRIRIIRDGPYMVTGSVPLSESIIDSNNNCYKLLPGRIYQLTGSYALCRCGHSQNMPFCDGSHAHKHFAGKETASRLPFIKRAARIDGPDLILADAEDLCAFARFCHTVDGNVWELTERSDDPADRKMAIKAASECLAGRLVAYDLEGRALENHYEPSIVVIQDPQRGAAGPLWVRGGIPVESADGDTYEVRNRVTLCRCGHSRNKPFCDAMHIAVGFQDASFGAAPNT